MTTLEIPLHIPVRQADRLLAEELYGREVISVKITDRSMVVEHKERMYVPPQSIGL